MVQNSLCMCRGSSEKRGGTKKAASGPPPPRTPAPGLWLLLPLAIAFREAGAQGLFSRTGGLAGAVMGKVGPLAPSVRYLVLFASIGVVALWAAGRLRAGRGRAYLPYAMAGVVALSSLANLFLLPALNLREPHWRFARKHTGSLTEAALMSPSRFREGHGRLCLMVRDYLRGRPLVTGEKDFFKIGSAYWEVILPGVSIQTVGGEMALTPGCAERMLSLPSEELSMPDGSIYRFVRSASQANERVLHLRYGQFNFLVPESVLRQVAREEDVPGIPGPPGRSR